MALTPQQAATLEHSVATAVMQYQSQIDQRLVQAGGTPKITVTVRHQGDGSVIWATIKHNYTRLGWSFRMESHDNEYTLIFTRTGKQEAACSKCGRSLSAQPA